MADYRLIRSDRRTLGLEITSAGEVLVRAPRWCRQGRIDRFVAEHTDWIARHREIQSHRAAQAAARAVTPQQEAALRREAAAYLPARVAHYAPLVGVVPAGVRITGAQKRFGSCSGKDRLCFSWRLMQYPSAAIDYVVVHELCHILHHDHSAAFWAAVARVMPDYKVNKALLQD